MIRTFWRFPAVAVSPKIGHDDIEVLREPGRNLVPGDVRLGPAVEKQHRAALAAMNKVYGSDARLDDGPLEAGTAMLELVLAEMRLARAWSASDQGVPQPVGAS